MRTTIDLPEDLHRLVKQIATSRRESLSATVSELVRRGLSDRGEAPDFRIRNGIPVIHLGRPITDEDVHALDDDA